ncbi:MAG: hypothetical protein ACPG5T_01490, partial [Endozoicomonas sp.]
MNYRYVQLWGSDLYQSHSKGERWVKFQSPPFDQYKATSSYLGRVMPEAMVIDNTRQMIWLRQDREMAGYSIREGKLSRDAWRVPFTQTLKDHNDYCPTWQGVGAIRSAVAAHGRRIVSVSFIPATCYAPSYFPRCPMPLPDIRNKAGLHISSMVTHSPDNSFIEWETFLEEVPNENSLGTFGLPKLALSDSRIYITANKNIVVLDRLTGELQMRKVLNDFISPFWDINISEEGSFQEPVVDRHGNFFTLYRNRGNMPQTVYGFFLNKDKKSFQYSSYTFDNTYTLSNGYFLLINADGELVVATGAQSRGPVEIEERIKFTWFDISQNQLSHLHDIEIVTPPSVFVDADEEWLGIDPSRYNAMPIYSTSIEGIDSKGGIYTKTSGHIFYSEDGSTERRKIVGMSPGVYRRISFGSCSTPDEKAFWSHKNYNSGNLNVLVISSDEEQERPTTEDLPGNPVIHRELLVQKPDPGSDQWLAGSQEYWEEETTTIPAFCQPGNLNHPSVSMRRTNMQMYNASPEKKGRVP